MREEKPLQYVNCENGCKQNKQGWDDIQRGIILWRYSWILWALHFRKHLTKMCVLFNCWEQLLSLTPTDVHWLDSPTLHRWDCTFRKEYETEIWFGRCCNERITYHCNGWVHLKYQVYIQQTASYHHPQYPTPTYNHNQAQRTRYYYSNGIRGKPRNLPCKEMSSIGLPTKTMSTPKDTQ